MVFNNEQAPSLTKNHGSPNNLSDIQYTEQLFITQRILSTAPEGARLLETPPEVREEAKPTTERKVG